MLYVARNGKLVLRKAYGHLDKAKGIPMRDDAIFSIASMTKVMTVEWAKHNIQINTVCPTVILTPMGEMVWGDPAKGDPMKAKIPAGRFGRTTEVADLILFLASSASDRCSSTAANTASAAMRFGPACGSNTNSPLSGISHPSFALGPSLRATWTTSIPGHA